MEKNRLTDWDDFRRYIIGGKSEIILASPSGISKRYFFKKNDHPPKDDKSLADKYFVSVRLNKKFEYIGYLIHELWDNNFKVFHTSGSHVAIDSQEWGGLKCLVQLLNNQNSFSHTPMKLYHSGVCSVCGRRLTTPESLQHGMGPVCRSKVRL